MVEAFSSSLEVCGVNSAVASPFYSKCPCSHWHASRLGFLTPFFSGRPAWLVPSWVKSKEAVFVHACTQVATVSHALCSEIETGI